MMNHGGPHTTILQALGHGLRRRFIEPFPLVLSVLLLSPALLDSRLQLQVLQEDLPPSLRPRARRVAAVLRRVLTVLQG